LFLLLPVLALHPGCARPGRGSRPDCSALTSAAARRRSDLSRPAWPGPARVASRAVGFGSPPRLRNQPRRGSTALWRVTPSSRPKRRRCRRPDLPANMIFVLEISTGSRGPVVAARADLSTRCWAVSRS